MENKVPSTSICWVVTEQLKAAGVEISLRYDHSGRSLRAENPSDAEALVSSLDGRMLRIRDEREVFNADPSRCLGLWLDEVPNDPEWLWLMGAMRERDRSAFVDRRDKLNDRDAWYVVFDRSVHPDLYDRLRELRWQGPARRAASRGESLPHLLN